MKIQRRFGEKLKGADIAFKFLDGIMLLHVHGQSGSCLEGFVTTSHVTVDVRSLCVYPLVDL